MNAIQKDVGGDVAYMVKGGIPTVAAARLLGPTGSVLQDWTALSVPFTSTVVSSSQIDSDDDLYIVTLTDTPPATLREERVRIDMDQGPVEWPVVEKVSGKTIYVRMQEGDTPLTVTFPQLVASISAANADTKSPVYRFEFRYTVAGVVEYASVYFPVVLKVVRLELTIGEFLDWMSDFKFLEGQLKDLWKRGLKTIAPRCEIEFAKHGKRVDLVAGEDQLVPMMVKAMVVALAENGIFPAGYQEDRLGFLEDARTEFSRTATDCLRDAYYDITEDGSIGGAEEAKAVRGAWVSR
jgi:hypothetical protein